MEEHVGRFLDETPVVGDRGDGRFARFLDELLRRAPDAGLGERRDVRALRPVAHALDDRAPQLGREARDRARVARRPRRLDPHEERVAVAVVPQLDDAQRVARRRALVPQLLPRAAPEPRFAGLARQPLGLRVHPREHEHAPARGVLDDRGAQLRLHRAPRRPARAARRATTRAGPGSRGGSTRAAPPARPRARRRRAARAGTARRDHRQRHRVAQLREELEVVAVARPVAVDRRHEQLARAALLALARPRDRVAAGLARGGVRVDATVLAVDRDDDRLAAEDLGELADQLRPRERRGVDRDLVRSRLEHRGGVGDGADPAADGERDRDLLGDRGGDLDRRAASVERRGDVEEDELVGARVGVRRSRARRGRRRRASRGSARPSRRARRRRRGTGSGAGEA